MTRRLVNVIDRAEPSTGRKIVAEWMLELWLKRPGWMTRMPDQADVDALVERIDNAIIDEQLAERAEKINL